MFTRAVRLLLFFAIANLALGCDEDAPNTPSGDFDLSSLFDFGSDRGLDLADTGLDPLVDSSSDPGLPPADLGMDSPDADVDQGPAPGFPDGSPCALTRECRGSRCLAEGTGFPGGLCTTVDCASGVACAGRDAVCATRVGFGSVCTTGCAEDEDCREGYSCSLVDSLHETLGACLPADESLDLADGEACEFRRDCAGEVCLPSPSYPGGHCTTLDCESDDDCNGSDAGAVCVLDPTTNRSQCLRSCEGDEDCRERYYCLPSLEGGRYCGPGAPPIPAPNPLEFDPPLVCIDSGVRFVFESELAEDTIRSTLFAVALDGSGIFADHFAGEDGVEVDFGSTNRQQALGGCLGGLVCSLTLPWTGEHITQRFTGPFEARFSSGASEICYHLIQDSEPGEYLDMNLIFMGLGHINEDNVDSDDDVAEVVEQSRLLFEQTGIAIRNVNYVFPSDAERAEYAIIRDDAGIDELVGSWEPEFATFDEAVSLDVYLVDDFLIGTLLGRAGAIPGPVALRGTRASGVAVATNSWGTSSGNEVVAKILIHEIGHQMGLFHTTELSGRAFDPLPDTPVCRPEDIADYESCPDFQNVMFPLLSSENSNLLTEDQAFMLRMIAFTKRDRTEE